MEERGHKYRIVRLTAGHPISDGNPVGSSKVANNALEVSDNKVFDARAFDNKLQLDSIDITAVCRRLHDHLGDMVSNA